MTETPQPTCGSLEAKIIRACRDHGNKCKLECPRRQVEDLGQIAGFESVQEQPDIDPKPSFLDRLKEVYRVIAHPVSR